MSGKIVDLMQKRSSARYPCSFEVQLEARGERLSGRALDFGAGGMRLVTERPVPPGSVILVDGIPYERPGRPAAEVAWVHNGNGCAELGVRFFRSPAFFETRPYGFKPRSEQPGLRSRVPLQVQEPSGELLSVGWVVQLGTNRLVFQSDDRPEESGSVRLVLGPVPEHHLPSLIAGAILEDVRISSPSDVGWWECEFRLVSVPERQRALLEKYLQLLDRSR